MSAQQASRSLFRHTLLQRSQNFTTRPTVDGVVAQFTKGNSMRSINYARRSVSAITPSQSRRRPVLHANHQTSGLPKINGPSAGNKRSIFIQTESTPNPDALKFLPNHPVLPEGFSTPFLEYLSPRSTLAPPHPSPLAAKLLNVEGVSSVFYGPDFITVTKSSDVNWAHVKPEVFSLITEVVTSGEQIVNTVERTSGENAQEGGEVDSLGYNEDDDEVVGMIKELLETRIRPAIQEDGGDIEFRGFENGIVMLKLRGACRTCDSSTVTLKNGIESMLMHYVSFDYSLSFLVFLVRCMSIMTVTDLFYRSKRSKALSRFWTRRKKSQCTSLPSSRRNCDSRKALVLLQRLPCWIRQGLEDLKLAHCIIAHFRFRLLRYSRYLVIDC